MSGGIVAFLVSAAYVILAEMGDKSQLLAMIFATKYPVYKVLIGISIATILNHGLAVWIGNLIAQIPSAQIWIKIIASITFITFGLLTLKGEDGEEEENKISRFGPILTVAMTFFIGEFGDKTQLTTFNLAASFPKSPIPVLIGAIIGMILADAIAITLGVIMCKRIPEKAIKLVSASAFIVFGYIGTWEILFNNFKLGTTINSLIMICLVILTVIPSYILFKNSKDETIGLKYCKPKE